ncbi:solute carrier family 26 member 6-like [Lutzomyia longipalpis]|uniref:solute carrier family 26 member 6-like n=1 Tax=Lutzomyia longipalpis TaxID=7200 RepID=UPI00248365B1|nr:solute carrier family 26 member 6-like [Lutzomyia longipalpis]XP_055694263.1 solute carrier family 26 member 6-like [Lutzomyia longipalpis]XP_055694264.1 solute carrier family 26 member 6-like [Lutzomyia longipalpis]XP_055694265.1 solute carrier family 26 member 6-like [Lutzomyia longipalpis]XP_055694266.1 solute carrier family 26 member 6-like [Lutzomyia longipalpis]XP_055694267.1 solute carrier family 26 member 6-like [Lutzomyia longipalpis]XP_055694268.1 solute carrier family 26 member 
MTVPNESTTAVKVSRPIYRLEQINQNFQYENHKENKWKSVVHKVKQIDFFRTLVSVIPILDWGRSYSAQNDLLPDFISGCTVAVMHIPQGMGYALLANVPPIMGIYTAFFPVLIYFLFGTSRHNSMGTFAVVSIMVGKLVVKYAGDANLPEDENLPTSLDVATIVTFMVGVYLLVFYIFRLGVVSTLLSDVLVSGFTTGCAIHVFTSQVKDILGLSLPQIPGYFDVVITYYEITQRISTANWVACCISGISIVVLIINNELLKPRLAKITIVPMPIELIAVVTGTLVSSQLRLAEDWGVNTIQNIPLGFPVLTPPKFALVRSIAADSFIIAIVSYTVAVSMALIFAQKFHYKIRFNQELLAMGIGNVFGSFFQCIPFCASLSRSVIQQTVGGRTQVASVVSCSILVFILLWVGKFFEPLPKCVLASIILVSLKGLLMQYKDFFKFWKCSRLDGFIWLTTFLTVVLVAIDVGLIVGITLSILTLLLKSLKPYVCLLGSVPGTEIYLDVTKYKGTVEIPNVKIFHYCGSLNFASRDQFRKLLFKHTGVNAKKIPSSDGLKDESPHDVRCIVMDFSAVTYVDSGGFTTLKAIIEELSARGILVLIAAISCPVYEGYKKSNLYDLEKEGMSKTFPTIHDAVQYALEKNIPISITYESIRL